MYRPPKFVAGRCGFESLSRSGRTDWNFKKSILFTQEGEDSRSADDEERSAGEQRQVEHLQKDVDARRADTVWPSSIRRLNAGNAANVRLHVIARFELGEVLYTPRIQDVLTCELPLHCRIAGCGGSVRVRRAESPYRVLRCRRRRDGGRRSSLRPRLPGGGERTVERAADASVEDDAGEDEVRTSPTVLGDERLTHRRKYESPHAGATDGNTRRHRTLRVEVQADHDDRRQIQETEADTCASIRLNQIQFPCVNTENRNYYHYLYSRCTRP